MKKNLTVFLFLLSGVFSFSYGQSIQIIHNSADPVFDTVDIYVDLGGGTTQLLVDDLGFRGATDFINVLSGTFRVALAPKTSTSIADTLFGFDFTTVSGTDYVVMVSGVDPANTSSFAPNPEARSIAFTPYTLTGAATQSANTGEIALTVAHGATDVPAVDIFIRELGALAAVDDATYSDIAGPLQVPAADVNIDISLSSDSAANVFTYFAPLATAGLTDSAVFVFASGFLNPTANQSGPAFGLFAATAGGNVIELPRQDSALVQIIHNSPDPLVDSVDIYLNDDPTPFLTSVKFRSGTAFLTVPANQQLKFGFAVDGPGGTTLSDVAVEDSIYPLANETYTVLASGVVDPTQFDPNPDAVPTAFGLNVIQGTLSEFMTMGQTALLAYHGSPDAPAVDVVAGGTVVLGDNLVFRNPADAYVAVPSTSYTVEIFDSTQTDVLASFTADLSSFASTPLFVFASGFRIAAQNQNGPEFGLFAIGPNGGEAIELPLIQPSFDSYVQLIHNSADPAFSTVDVYAIGPDGFPLLVEDDFNFREATEFIEIEDGTWRFAFAPGNSTGIADTLFGQDLTILPNTNYVAMAAGVNPANVGSFAANPDGNPISFAAYALENADTASQTSGEIALTVAHGATDVPAVDIFIRELGTAAVVNDAAFGDIAGPLQVPGADVTIDISLSNDSAVNVFTYSALLQTAGLTDSAVFVFASGFLDPAANQSGPSFGLFAATAQGTVIGLTLVDTAAVQIIHNAPDPILDSVDIFLYDDAAPALTNVKFRTASNFLSVDGNRELVAGFALHDPLGTTRADIVFFDTLFIEAGKTYYAIASGVVDPTQFASNPDGVPTDLQVVGIEGALNEFTTPGEVALGVYHGSPDAPTVDAITGAGTVVLADDLAYTDITPTYAEVPAASYDVDVTDATGSTTIGTYRADVSGLAENPILVFASGFVDPATNQNGPAFGLFAITPAGGVAIELPLVVSNNTLEEYADFVVYPNPSRGIAQLRVDGKLSLDMEVSVLDVLGRTTGEVIRINSRLGRQEIALPTEGLGAGLYQVLIETSEGNQVLPLVIK